MLTCCIQTLARFHLFIPVVKWILVNPIPDYYTLGVERIFFLFGYYLCIMNSGIRLNKRKCLDVGVFYEAFTYLLSFVSFQRLLPSAIEKSLIFPKKLVKLSEPLNVQCVINFLSRLSLVAA